MTQVKLRDYQQRTIDLTYNYLSNKDGNPCIVLPTGAGKSHIVATLCKDALQKWPETRILMLTHMKELIEQNASKLREHWPGAPLGIYSAGIGRRELGEPITFAGIQSVRKRAQQIGHIDLIIIDECHLVSHKDEGGYRSLIADLLEINPRLRVIGLTATPWRLGHGLITDQPAIFSDLIEPTSIEELISKGHLAPLHSKHTELFLNVDGVHKRGGEYIERELQKAVDTKPQNLEAVREIINRAEDRQHWLLFCTGVDHAEHIKEILNHSGVPSETLNGATGKKERERILSDFRSGKIKALTNCNVLTTGFDFPNIDLMAFLRPTLSPVLYVQMGGRGMRPKTSDTDHCLVLDFAGLVKTHGPITAVQPPRKKGEKKGETPTKVCDECQEIVHLSAKACPTCGAKFPEPEAKKSSLHFDDIMGLEASEMEVNEWRWRVHKSAASGKLMLRVDYYSPTLSDPVVSEYLTVTHSGGAGERAMRTLAVIARSSDVVVGSTLAETSERLQAGKPPKAIEYKKDGKFFRVLRRSWGVKQLEFEVKKKPSKVEMTCACGCGEKHLVNPSVLKKGWGKYINKEHQTNHGSTMITCACGCGERFRVGISIAEKSRVKYLNKEHRHNHCTTEVTCSCGCGERYRVENSTIELGGGKFLNREHRDNYGKVEMTCACGCGERYTVKRSRAESGRGKYLNAEHKANHQKSKS